MTQANALSDSGNDRIHPGANMSPFDLIVGEIEAFYDEAKNWADGTPIASQEQHDAVEALYDALHKAGQEAEALRVAEVKPLDEAKAAIQSKFHPLIGDTKAGKGKVILGKASLNTMLTAWRTKVAAEKAAIAAAAKKEADDLAAKALAAMQAASGNLEEREKAEEMLSFAQEATKYAARTEKAATTGLGLRTSWAPVLIDRNLAIKHYWQADPGAFERLVLDLAITDVRVNHKREIPGFRVDEIKGAI